jgi:outer membrane lipoprotein-sorting protein
MAKLFVLILVCAPLVLSACSAGDGKTVASKAVEGKKNYHASGDILKAKKKS